MPFLQKKRIDAFKSKFKIYKGKEYFIGEDIDMMKSVFRCVLNNGVKNGRQYCDTRGDWYSH